jgi:hypothetical protein
LVAQQASSFGVSLVPSIDMVKGECIIAEVIRCNGMYPLNIRIILNWANKPFIKSIEVTGW